MTTDASSDGGADFENWRAGLEGRVRLAKLGERSAVEGLLVAIRPLVVRYCRARIGRVERSFVLADGVAREVCLAVLGALPGYRAKGCSFLALVYGVAVNEVAGVRRTAELGGFSEQTARLIVVLPEKQREILLLRVAVGFSVEETADAVGLSAGAVRVAQHKALTELRRLIDAEAEKEKA